MDIPLDEVIYVEGIASSSTGAAADADSTPTFAVYEEATDTDIGVGGNMTKRTSLTGDYRASFTASAANGFELGKWYVVIGSATIGAVATKGILARFRIVAAESTAGYPKNDTVMFGGSNGTFSGGRPEVDLARWLGVAPLTLSSQQVQSVIPSSTSILAVTGSVGSVTATVAANLVSILGSAITGTAAQLAAAFSWFFNVASPTGTVNSLPDASPDDIAAGGLLTIRKLIRYVQLMFRKDAAIAADNATELGEINANRGSGAGSAANTSDALEALRDNLALETTSQTIAGYINDEITAIIATLATISGLIDTEIAAIKLKTDNLPSDPADASTIADSFTTLDAAVAAVSTIATALQKLARADRKIDKTTDPAAWDEVLYEEGTPTELLRRELFDVDGAALADEETIVGRAVKPA